MRHTKKTIVAMMTAGLMMGSTAYAADPINVAWVHSNAAAQSEQGVKAGFEEWLGEAGYGWNVSFLDSGGAGDATAQNIQDAAARGVDAIIITMSDLRASKAAIDVAVEAGIPIFSVDSGFVEGVMEDLTTNNWAMSSDVSPFLLDAMGNEGGLIFLRMTEHHGTRKRGDVMEKVLQEYSGVKVLDTHYIDYTAFFEDTTATMQDYAARFGDEITAVWAPWDEPAQAAINTLRAAGITNVKVVGIDGHPNAIKEICDPDGMMIATVSQPFGEMGAQVGEWIQAIVVEGQARDDVIPSDIVYMDAPLVTKQNCADFM